jgi:uncharacterized protein (DUF342 family)
MFEEPIVQADVTTDAAQVDATTETTATQEEAKVENPYEARLKELEAEVARKEEDLRKKEEIIQRKEETIRKASKKSEPPAEFEDRFKALEEKLIDKDVRETIAGLTSDPHERELAFRMYKDRIVKSGNVLEDVKMAFGAANADLTLKSRQQVAEQEAFESSLATRTSTHVSAPQSGRSLKSAERKLAESMLDRIDPAAKKYLDKYLI